MRDRTMNGESQQMLRLRTIVSILAGAALAAACCALAAQSSLVQIPGVSVAAGIPGTETQTVCSAALDPVGDGCPPSQALLKGPFSTIVDTYGNIYVSDGGNARVRVIYEGNPALAAAIVASYNNSAALSLATIHQGYIYNLVGGGSSPNSGATGGPGGSTSISSPLGLALDSDGNIVFGDGSPRLAVFYVGGTKILDMAKSTGSPTSAMSPGYFYLILHSGSSGYGGDGGKAYQSSVPMLNGPRGVAVDANEDIYIADFTNNAIREIDATTGLMNTVVGGPGCVQGTTGSCTDASAGDGGPGTSASTGAPYTLAFDANGNLYFSEWSGSREIRALYLGSGSLPGVSSPVSNNVYRVAAGGTMTTSGVPATSIKLSTAGTVGLDAHGNMYLADGSLNTLWRVDAATGLATIIGGGGVATAAGGPCLSSNPIGAQATDTVGDGCLATQATFSRPQGALTFDVDGNFYLADDTNNLVRRFSYNIVFPAAATGSAPAVTTLGFEALGAVALGSVNLGVEGAAAADFQDAGTSTCVSGTSLALAESCLLNVAFSPQLPGLRPGYVELTSSTGSPLASAYLGGTGSGAELAVDPGRQASIGEGLAPRGVAADPSGHVYVADGASSTLLEFAPGTSSTPSATLIAGLSSPGQVAVDGEGNVAVADAGNNRIAIYNRQTGSTGYLTDSFNSPQGVAVDLAGNYYIADTGNGRVVEVGTAGSVSILPADVTAPTRLAFDRSGNLYILDSASNHIVELPGGTGSQVTVSTGAFSPVAMAFDAAGDLYLLDSAGGEVGVLSPSNASHVLLSDLSQPADLSVDSQGNVYVADSANPSILALDRQSASYQFGVLNVGDTSLAANFTLTAIGDQTVGFANQAIAAATGDTAEFSVLSEAGNGCTPTLASGSQCVLAATFTPDAVASFQESLTFPANTGVASQTTIQLAGQGANLNRTALNLTVASPANAGSLVYGTPITVAIALSVLTGSGTPTGTVEILVNGVEVESVPVGSGGVSYTLTPQAGSVTVSAAYSGDGSFASSNASLLLTIVPASTTTALSISSSLSGTSPELVLAVNVSSTVPGVNGLVTFLNGATALGTAAIDAQGDASLTVTSLALTDLTFTASFAGGGNFAASASSVLTVDGDFGLTPSLNLATPQGGIATGILLVTPYFGLTGPIHFSCTGLPAGSICRAYPQTVTFAPSGSVPATVQMQIYTNIAPSTAALGSPAGGRQSGRYGPGVAVASLLLWGLFLAPSSRWRRQLLILLLAPVLTIAVTGCSSRTTSAALTPPGTYTVTLSATSASGVTHSSSLNLVVAPAD